MDGWDDDREESYNGPCCDQMRLYNERQKFLKQNPTIAGSVSDRLRLLSNQPGMPHPSGIRILSNDTRALEERIATLQSLRDTLAETIASGRLREADIPDDYAALVRGITATREGG